MCVTELVSKREEGVPLKGQKMSKMTGLELLPVLGTLPEDIEKGGRTYENNQQSSVTDSNPTCFCSIFTMGKKLQVKKYLYIFFKRSLNFS